MRGTLRCASGTRRFSRALVELEAHGATASGQERLASSDSLAPMRLHRSLLLLSRSLGDDPTQRRIIARSVITLYRQRRRRLALFAPLLGLSPVQRCSPRLRPKPSRSGSSKTRRTSIRPARPQAPSTSCCSRCSTPARRCSRTTSRRCRGSSARSAPASATTPPLRC